MTNYNKILAACKDEVAKGWDCDDWEHFFTTWPDVNDIEKALNEAALLAMQRVAEAEQNKAERVVALVKSIDDTLFHHNHAIVGWHLNGDHEPIMNFVAEFDMEVLNEYTKP